MAQSVHVKSWALPAFIMLCCTVDIQQAAKILFVPSLEYSHCSYMNALGEELVQRGHEVSMYMCQQINYRDCPGPHFEVIKFSWSIYKNNLNFSEKLLKDIFHCEGNTLFTKAIQIKEMMCEMIQEDDIALQSLHDKKFDLAIIDGRFFTQCFYLIPYNLSIPFISVSGILTKLERSSMILSSLSPDIDPSITGVENFEKRLLDTLWYAILHVAGVSSVPLDHFKLAPTLSSSEVEILYRKSELFFDNSDIILNNAQSIWPQFRQVGGMTTRPGKPLSKSLQKFFDGAKYGVIVITFETIFENITDKHYLSTLEYLPQRILLKTNVNKTRGNVKMMTWLPLNDICAHPKTVLLISHCDSNSHFESLYHGVPLICLPVRGEQFQIASKIEYYKMGLKLNIRKLKPETFYFAALNVTTRPIYRQNAQAYSKIFRNHSSSPRQIAADSVEEVLQFGSRHLENQNVNYSWYQMLNLDVWLFINLVILIAIYMIVCSFNDMMS